MRCSEQCCWRWLVQSVLDVPCLQHKRAMGNLSSFWCTWTTYYGRAQDPALQLSKGLSLTFCSALRGVTWENLLFPVSADCAQPDGLSHAHARTLTRHRQQYATHLLAQRSMQKSHPNSTPLSPSARLYSSGQPLAHGTDYRQTIGSLLL